jgi:hypothetical protein
MKLLRNVIIRLPSGSLSFIKSRQRGQSRIKYKYHEIKVSFQRFPSLLLPDSKFLPVISFMFHTIISLLFLVSNEAIISNIITGSSNLPSD